MPNACIVSLTKAEKNKNLTIANSLLLTIVNDHMCLIFKDILGNFYLMCMGGLIIRNAYRALIVQFSLPAVAVIGKE